MTYIPRNIPPDDPINREPGGPSKIVQFEIGPDNHWYQSRIIALDDTWRLWSFNRGDGKWWPECMPDAKEEIQL